MDAIAFAVSLKGSAPPPGLSNPCSALWHAAKRDFAKAGDLLRSDASREAAWVRAHIHRAKGESAEAGEWYRRAGKSPASNAFDAEVNEIAASLLLHA